MILAPITAEDHLTAVLFKDISPGVLSLIDRTKVWHRVIRDEEGDDLLVVLIYDDRGIERYLTEKVRITQEFDFHGQEGLAYFESDIGAQTYFIDEVLRIYEVTMEDVSMEAELLAVRDYLLTRDERRGLNASLVLNARYTVSGRDQLYLPVRRVSGIMADTGIGKSIFISNLLVANRRRALVINSEMDGVLYLERLLRIHTGYNHAGILELYEHATFAREMSRGFDWLKLVHEHITFDKLAVLIEYHQPEIVVLDTYDGILTPGMDEYARDTFLSKSLIDLARKHECAIVCVYHINKQGMVGGNEGRLLTLSDIKGATHLPQKCYQVLALEGDRQSDYRTLRTVKNREGFYVHEHAYVMWSSGRFYPIQNYNSKNWDWPAGKPWARSSIKDLFHHE